MSEAVSTHRISAKSISRWRDSNYQNLIQLPYYQVYDEYTAIIRSEILSHGEMDFKTSVNLSRGFEEIINKAEKGLPTLSVDLDSLMRGIPTIPSSTVTTVFTDNSEEIPPVFKWNNQIIRYPIGVIPSSLFKKRTVSIMKYSGRATVGGN